MPIGANQQCYLKTVTGEVTDHEGCCDRGLTCQDAAGFKIEYKKTCQAKPGGPPQQGSACTSRDTPYTQTMQYCGKEILLTKCHCDARGQAPLFLPVDGKWQCTVIDLPFCPCENKKTGDSCTLCAPWDTGCMETMDLKTCSKSGVCQSGGGLVTILPPVTTVIDEQCALITCKPGFRCRPGKGCVAYNNCAKKQRGDACRQCHAKDTWCVETAVTKTCQDDMSTLGHALTCMAETPAGPPQQGSTCTRSDNPYTQTIIHCGKKFVVQRCYCDTTGDGINGIATGIIGKWQCAMMAPPQCPPQSGGDCSISDDAPYTEYGQHCGGEIVVKRCECDNGGNATASAQWLCAMPLLVPCTYDACEDKTTGDSCTQCAPWDTDCVETENVKTCSDGGVCTAGGPVECALIKCKEGFRCRPGRGCVKIKKPKPCKDKKAAFCAKKLPATFSDTRIAEVCKKRKNIAKKCQLSCGICTKP